MSILLLQSALQAYRSAMKIAKRGDSLLCPKASAMQIEAHTCYAAVDRAGCPHVRPGHSAQCPAFSRVSTCPSATEPRPQEAVSADAQWLSPPKPRPGERSPYSTTFAVTTRMRGLSPLFTSDFPTTTFCPSRISISLLSPVVLYSSCPFSFRIPDGTRICRLRF